MAKQTLHTAPAFPKALRKWEGLDVLKHAPMHGLNPAASSRSSNGHFTASTGFHVVSADNPGGYQLTEECL